MLVITLLAVAATGIAVASTPRSRGAGAHRPHVDSSIIERSRRICWLASSPWAAADAAAGVGARAALVVAVDRCAVLVPAGRRAEEVGLRREHLAVEDVALRQPRHLFDVERRDDLALQHEVGEAGEERLQRVLHVVGHVLALLGPVAALQVVRRVLDEARHDVLAGRRHVGVDRRLDRAVDVRPRRVPAVLGFVEGALEVLHRRRDVGEAAEHVGAVAAAPG